MVVNDLPNLKENDLKDFRTVHLHTGEPSDYNLIIVYTEPMFDKQQSLDFLKSEGLF
jgi:hypothetical protein